MRSENTSKQNGDHCHAALQEHAIAHFQLPPWSRGERNVFPSSFSCFLFFVSRLPCLPVGENTSLLPCGSNTSSAQGASGKRGPAPPNSRRVASHLRGRMCDRHRDRAHRSIPSRSKNGAKAERKRSTTWTRCMVSSSTALGVDRLWLRLSPVFPSVGYWFACPVIFLSFLYCCWALLFARKLFPAHAPG